MSVKVLIDAMLPWRLANVFRECGHEARHVRRLKELGRTDELTWKAAIANNEIVVTCEMDFKLIQTNNQSTKLILYKRINLNRTRILEDFTGQMKAIEAFAAGSESRLEIG